MTMKEKIYRLKELRSEIEELYYKKTELQGNSYRFNLNQDWDKALKELEKKKEQLKQIEKEIIQKEAEYEEIKNELLQLTIDLNIDVIEFEVGNLIIKVQRNVEDPIQFLYNPN